MAGKGIHHQSDFSSVELTEVELLHPASLDSLGSLPNLEYLSVTGASVIGNHHHLRIWKSKE